MSRGYSPPAVVSAASRTAPLRAGVASVELEAPLGVPMMGYGARAGPAGSRRDALYARALYLAAGSNVLWVESDLCLMAPAQADRLRQRIAERTGVPAERVLAGCTHTHSGPDTGLGAWLGGTEPPPHVEALFDAAVEAAAKAAASAAPARLGLGRTQARIGINRRVEGGPVDTDVLVARIDGPRGGPRAVLYVHGCHPTALGHDNLAYSADWPGAAARAIEAALPGATAVFALGAHADVDPRTRGLLDLAIPGQSVGVGFDEMEALGRELGEAVAAAAAEIETRADAVVDARATKVDIPVHGAEGGEASYARALAARRAEALAALGLPPDAQVGTAELFRLGDEQARTFPPEQARERIARLRLYLRDRTAPRFAGGYVPEVCVQVIRIGDALLLALPAEPTVDVGLDWKRRAGAPFASVLGIANGWLRYLPHPRNFEAPGAEQSYEVLMSTLVPDAAERLLATGERLARDLGGVGARRGERAAVR